MRIIPNSAVKFLLYEQLSRSLSHRAIDAGGDGRLSPYSRLAAGAAAGIVAMSATYPLDMVRGRLTVQGGAGEGKRGGAAYAGIADAARRIARDEGVVALWRGWLPSVIGVMPYVGLNFAVYETLKVGPRGGEGREGARRRGRGSPQAAPTTNLPPPSTMKDTMLRVRGLRDERDLPVAVRLACGAAAGTTGQTVAYPLDVVRRRMQMSGWAGATGLHHEAGGGAVAYKGMVDCFRRTVAEEGPRALFKGLWPNYVKVGDGGRGRGGEKGASCAFFVSTAAHASPSPPPRPCAGGPVHRHRVCVVRAAQGGHGRAAAHFQLRRREGRGGEDGGRGSARVFHWGTGAPR